MGGANISFPSQVWKNGDHWNFIGQGSRYQTKDSTFHTWTNMDGPGHKRMVNFGESSGQWWIPVPNMVDGSSPPAGVANRIVNIGNGDKYLFGNYYPENESFIPWAPNGEKPGKIAQLERGGASWFGAQMTSNNRLLLIGWATPDFSGNPGGAYFLSRLTLLREVNYDAKTQNLVVNPVPELKG